MSDVEGDYAELCNETAEMLESSYERGKRDGRAEVLREVLPLANAVGEELLETGVCHLAIDDEPLCDRQDCDYCARARAFDALPDDLRTMLDAEKGR